MASPAIFAGKHTKLLTSGGVLRSNGQVLNYDGHINYITRSNFEDASSVGFALYNDGAAAAPVDGTGGVASCTLGATAGSQLRGIYGLNFAKSNANEQGEGFSYDFTIDPADKCRVLRLSFDYMANNDFIADGAIAIWIYDRDTSTLIQPAPYALPGVLADTPYQFCCEFQTTTSVNYRVVFHVVTTGTAISSMKFNNFYLGPKTKSVGFAGYDPRTYGSAASFQGMGTPTNISLQESRRGKYLRVEGTFTAGTTTVAEGRIYLPSGYTIEFPTAGYRVVGRAIRNSTTSTAGKDFTLIAQNGDQWVKFSIGDTAGTQTPFNPLQGSQLFLNGENISFWFEVPLLGASSSTVTSDSAATRPVFLSATKSGNQPVTASVTDISFTAVKDSHGAWNGTQYIVKVPGSYVVAPVISDTGANSRADIFVDGVATRYGDVGGAGLNGGAPVLLPDLKAGQAISIRDGYTGTIYAPTTSLSIWMLQGPSQIAASETIKATYTTAAAQSLATAGTDVTILYGTKVADSHGAYNPATGVFTAPQARRYRFTASFGSNSTVAFDAYAYIRVKQGSTVKKQRYEFKTDNHSRPVGAEVTAELDLLAGDTVLIAVNQGLSGSLTLSGVAEDNVLTICSVANY